MKTQSVSSAGPFGIPSDFPVQPIGLYDAAVARCTCGHCGLSWDDGIATQYTPAPSGRCPFEVFHKYEDDAPSPSVVPAKSCPNCGHDQDGADPTHCLDCGWPLPAPVVPVEVPSLERHTSLPWKVEAPYTGVDDRLNISPEHPVLNDNMVVAQCFGPDKERNAEFITRACSSHAANLAKIKALETALIDLLADAVRMDARLLVGQPDPGCEKGSIVRARAALALPSAPPSLES